MPGGTKTKPVSSDKLNKVIKFSALGCLILKLTTGKNNLQNRFNEVFCLVLGSTLIFTKYDISSSED